MKHMKMEFQWMTKTVAMFWLVLTACQPSMRVPKGQNMVSNSNISVAAATLESMSQSGVVLVAPQFAMVSINVGMQLVAPNGDSVAVAHWDFGDGSPILDSGASTNHTYFNVGTSIITAQATDSLGNSFTLKQTVNVLAYDEAALCVSGLTLSAPLTVDPGQSVPLSVAVPVCMASRTTGVTWDFGDNSNPLTGSTSTVYSYANPGLYNITATVNVPTSPVPLVLTAQVEVKAPQPVPPPDNPPPVVFPQTQLAEMASAAFEDLYPNEGDKDFNDTIVNFSIKETVNASNQLTDISVLFVPRVACAGYDHAILLNTTGVSAHKAYHSKPMFVGDAAVSRIAFDREGQITSTTSDLNANDDLVVFASTKNLFIKEDGTLSNGNCFAGDVMSSPNASVRMDIHLAHPELNPVTSTTIDISTFRIMLHVLNTDQYVDMVDVNPTEIDSRGMPWGLVVPVNWGYPLETQDVSNIYLQFDNYLNEMLLGQSTPGFQLTPDVADWFNHPSVAASGIYFAPELFHNLVDPTKRLFKQIKAKGSW